MIKEVELRKEFRALRKSDPVFAECWPDKDRAFYEWCSQYLDYKHIKPKDEE